MSSPDFLPVIQVLSLILFLQQLIVPTLSPEIETCQEAIKALARGRSPVDWLLA